MRTKNLTLAFVVICLLLVSMSSVLAVKAKIGNSKMVLRPEVGETIERYIRVINDNPETVTITFIVSGDLADNVELEQETYIVPPNDEVDAIFTIKADKPKKTETKINVVFTPEEGSGVGLSSTIIVIPETDGEFEEFEDNEFEELSDTEDTEEESGGVSFKPSASKIDKSALTKKPISSTTYMLIGTLVLTLTVVSLFIYYYRTSSNKFKKRVTKRRG